MLFRNAKLGSIYQVRETLIHMIAFSLCRRYSRLCSDFDLCSLDSLAECRLQKDRHQIVKDHAQRVTNAPDRELRLVSGCEVLAEFISQLQGSAEQARLYCHC